MNRSDTGIVAAVRRRLLNLSNERGEDYNLVLVRYGLERFLYRLSESHYRTRFILKGAMLFNYGQRFRRCGYSGSGRSQLPNPSGYVRSVDPRVPV